jgi:hypothetical protein
MLAALVVLMVGAPTSAAAGAQCPHRFGTAQRLVDANGAVVQEWTVTGLHPSADPATGYPLAGQLWEATVTVHAVSGAVTPIIPNLHAMSVAGEHYPVLWQVASPTGLSGATLAEGQSATGKVYFDVTGSAPAGVGYSAGAPMPAMMWCDDAAMMQMMKSMAGPMRGMDDCPCCAN